MSEIRHQPHAPTLTQRREAGDRIDRHRHEDHQLVYVSTGVLAVSTAAGRWVASADRAVWLPAGTWHQHRFYGASAFHSIGFGVERPPLPIEHPAVVAVGPLLRELLVALTQGMPDAEARRLRAVVHDQFRRAHEEPIMLPTPRDERLAAACALATEQLDAPVSLANLARALNVGERTLSRLFRREFGMTYPQWRTRVRVFEAMILLAGGATVTDTATRCGWATTSSFVDTFHRMMGRTPGSYRAR